MKKINGAEYKAFINADWDTLLGVTNAFHDGEEITVNGFDEPFDTEEVPDDARVVIYAGCVMADQDIDLSLEACYMRWKKAQTVTRMVIEVPNASVDALKEFATRLKCKVLK